MNRNVVIGVVVVLVVIVGGAVAFPLVRPLFVDDAVSEAFPGLSPTQRAVFDNLPEAQRGALLAMVDENAEMAAEMADAMTSPDTVVSTAEGAPPRDMPAEPVVLAEGMFNEIDFVHRGEGSATIYELPDGGRVLRFENFRVTNGPDLHVFIAEAANATQSSELGEHIDLGQLKGNVGDQNYEIPADLDLSQFNSIVIYCVPFQVVFSVASFNSGA